MSALDQNAMNAFARKPEGRAKLAKELDAARHRRQVLVDVIRNAEAGKASTEEMIAQLEIALAQPELEA